MIILQIGGGMGNQLFQYAFARYLAHKYNTELKFDTSLCEVLKNSNHSYYRLGEFNIKEKVATDEEISEMQYLKTKNKFGEFLPENMNLPDNICFFGNFGNEKYFKDIRDILLKELTLKNPLHKNSATWEKKILSAENSVSLHVRLGDYVGVRWRGRGGVIDLNFYVSCLNELKKIYSNFKVFIFSDDLKLAKYLLAPIINIPVEFVENCETDAEELYLMSICKNNIVPNSTFSWWAAWLNQNPDKKVFIPKGFMHLHKNQIEIPAEYVANPGYGFQPFLSIILYVENNIDTVEIAISSILSQKFKDYELIIIDTGTDGSGKICRQFCQNENVTVLKANYTSNEIEAWNTGLKIARGSYVTFLNAKNFMFSHSADVMSFCAFSTGNRVVNNTTVYNFANFEDFSSDIICAVQNVIQTSEIADDSASVEDKFTFDNVLKNGFDGRKFSMIIDKKFSNIERYEKLKFDNMQKLELLTSGQLNTAFYTKIFKRKFLIENKITFKYKNNEIEFTKLHFLADAFTQTDDIVIINRTFGGILE